MGKLTCWNCEDGIHSIACGYECDCGCHASAVLEPVEGSVPRFAQPDQEPKAHVYAYTAEDWAVMVSILVVIWLWIFAAYRAS